MTVNRSTILIKQDSRVLVIPTNGGWSLPVVEEGPLKIVYIGPLQQTVCKLLGVKVAIGRQLWKQENHYLYEAFLLDNGNGCTWKELIELNPIEGEPQQVVQQWYEEREVPKVRAPWFRDGYYDETNKWIKTELEKAGYLKTGNIEQVKATDFSLVQILPTNLGKVYFKAVSEAAEYEPAISNYIDKAHPGKTTSIISIHSANAWMLMKDIEGTPLRSIKDKAIWEKAILDYAELQIAEMNHIRTLLDLGVPNRDLTLLREHIYKYLEGMCDTGLCAEDKGKVMSIQNELMEMCDELAEILPIVSIDHGDLHSANIQFIEDNTVFLDWGDAIITHPFFSTRVFWNSLYELTENDTDEEWQEMIAHFRPIYLEAWSKFAPKNILERALAISDQLGCIQRALSYYLYYTPNTEDQSDFNKPSLWLLALLEEREFAKVV